MTEYDISTATFSQSFDVSAQVGRLEDVAFKPDGTKMYIADGFDGTEIHEYDLTTAFDISTVAYVDTLSVSENPNGIAFNPDGSQMFVGRVRISTEVVYEYTLSTAFDVTTASQNDWFDPSGDTSDVDNVAFNSDGTKLYIISPFPTTVYEYDLSSAYDLTSVLTPASASFTADPPANSAFGITWKPDGTKLYLSGRTSDFSNDEAVFEYDLSTPFDISTASHSKTLDVSGQSTNAPQGMAFNDDGTKMFVAHDDEIVYEYNLPKAPISLSASLSGLGSMTVPPFDLVRGLTASPSGVGSTLASLVPARGIAGSLEGAGTTTASLGVVRGLSAPMNGPGELSARFTIPQPISASLAGSGVVDSPLHVMRPMDASLTGVGTTVSVLTRFPTPGVSWTLHVEPDGFEVVDYLIGEPHTVVSGEEVTIQVGFENASKSAYETLLSYLTHAGSASTMKTIDGKGLYRELHNQPEKLLMGVEPSGENVSEHVDGFWGVLMDGSDLTRSPGTGRKLELRLFVLEAFDAYENRSAVKLAHEQ